MISRTKLENIFSLGFNILNLSLYIITMAASMMKMVVEHRDVSQILTCIYAFLLSMVLFMMEARSFDIANNHFKLFTLYRGRSIMLLLLGSIIISTVHTFMLVAGILNLSFGFLYFLFSFVPSYFPLPRPVTENWQNWEDYSAEGLDLDRPRRKQQNAAGTIDNATRLKLSMIEKPQHKTNSKTNPV